MIQITRIFNFSAVYQYRFSSLWNGYEYQLEVSLCGDVDRSTGYVMDMKILKGLVQGSLIQRIHKRNLNTDVDFLLAKTVTMEVMVHEFYQQLVLIDWSESVRISRVVLIAGDIQAEYRVEDVCW